MLPARVKPTATLRSIENCRAGHAVRRAIHIPHRPDRLRQRSFERTGSTRAMATLLRWVFLSLTTETLTTTLSKTASLIG